MKNNNLAVFSLEPAPVRPRRVRRRRRRVWNGPAVENPPADMRAPAGTDPNKPVCGVVAVAVAARVTYGEAYAVLYPYVMRRLSRWKGSTTRTERQAALGKLGVKTVEIALPRRMSLKTWVYNEAKPGVRYMVQTTRHVQIVKDGHVTDQRGTRRIEDYADNGKMVCHVLRILD